MLCRRATQVALQAALLLAVEPGGSRRVRELAAKLNLPATYLTKVLQALTHAGLLRAVRGPGGGVQLSRAASEVSLWDVISAVEPAGELDRCFLGLGRCGDSNPCALHETWGPIRGQMMDMLRRQSLLDFASDAAQRHLLNHNGNHGKPEAGEAGWGQRQEAEGEVRSSKSKVHSRRRPADFH